MEAKNIRVMDVESGDSSTNELELPRSVVVMPTKKKVERVHSQVLRIRDEESLLVEDFFGVDNENEDKNDVIFGGFDERRRRQRRRVSVVLVSRRILPCSPLSGKSNVKRPCGEAITQINQIHDYGREILEKDYSRQASIEGELQYLG